MKTGSRQSDYEMTVCSMCGAVGGDFWQTRPTRPILLRRHPRPGDTKHICVLCDECFEGLRGLNRLRKCSVGNNECQQPEPARVPLLSQARRATIDDQRALLEWLLRKFKLEATPKA
jgi:hypothetical protein